MYNATIGQAMAEDRKGMPSYLKMTSPSGADGVRAVAKECRIGCIALAQFVVITAGGCGGGGFSIHSCKQKVARGSPASHIGALNESKAMQKGTYTCSNTLPAPGVMSHWIRAPLDLAPSPVIT